MFGPPFGRWDWGKELRNCERLRTTPTPKKDAELGQTWWCGGRHGRSSRLTVPCMARVTWPARPHWASWVVGKTGKWDSVLAQASKNKAVVI